MTSMILNTIGGGLGLLLFGWISDRLGRKGAFIFYHLAAFRRGVADVSVSCSPAKPRLF